MAKEKTYSITINVRVSDPPNGKRGYFISGWKDGVFTPTPSFKFYPFNYKKPKYMQDLGEKVFEAVKEMIAHDPFWK